MSPQHDVLDQGNKYNMLNAPVKYESLGALNVLTPETTGAIGPNRDDANLSKLADTLPRARVAVDPRAPSCCIDGRCFLHYANGNTNAEPRAKVAGGGLMSGYAALEMTNKMPAGADQATKLQYVAEMLKKGDLKPGGHGSQESCGASKLYKEITNKVKDPESSSYKAADGIARFMWNMQDNNPSPLLDGAGAYERSQNWNPAALSAKLIEDDPESMEVLEEKHDETHGHEEIAIILNYVEDTTIDRDMLAKQGTQAFVIDMWYIEKMAAALSGDVSRSSDDYLQMRHALTVYQVATAFTLTNGSQELITVKPEVAAQAA